ncbi:histidinol-phosphatase [bacterium]|nr:histidinol-phosphatase [bacterium]
MVDLHNHTPYCHHAEGRPEEFVEKARALGIREFGFAEHSPWMFQYEDDPPIAPTWDEFRAYEEDLEKLRDQLADDDINLRIGIEVDFVPEQFETARSFTANYPFDFHIGSVHNLGDWIFDHPDHLEEWDGRDVDAVYEEYFQALKSMLGWGLIDIVAHLDLPKKFGHLPGNGYYGLVEELIPVILDSGAVVEINTAGKDKPVGEYYPSIPIIRRLAGAGVPLTIGSDAHRPAEVGRYRDEVLTILRECGVTELFSFDNRTRVPVCI